MVIGHHSHQPQPIEVYQGKPILYSLANFVHDLEGFRGRTLMALLVRCLISDGKIQRLSYVPGILRGQGPPDFARPAQVPEVVQHMEAYAKTRQAEASYLQQLHEGANNALRDMEVVTGVPRGALGAKW